MDKRKQRKRFGTAIKLGRTRLGLSQEECGARVDLSAEQLGRIERGEVMPPWDIGERLRLALDLPLSLAYLESEESRLLV